VAGALEAFGIREVALDRLDSERMEFGDSFGAADEGANGRAPFQ
jgi:hypothetical protein